MLKNDFPEYRDVVDAVLKEFTCTNLREIRKVPKSWGKKPQAKPEAGQVIMPDGMDKERFASVLVEEVCHVCLAPGTNKQKILNAIKVALRCDEGMAYTISNYVADLICEFEIAKRPSLVRLRMPKIREFLGTSYDSQTLREIQAIFAQLYRQQYCCSSPLFGEISGIMETIQDRVDQFVEIPKLFYPIINREVRGSRVDSNERNNL